MAQFVKVGSRTEFEDLEGGKLVEVGGHRIAVFNVGGSYYAIQIRVDWQEQASTSRPCQIARKPTR